MLISLNNQCKEQITHLTLNNLHLNYTVLISGLNIKVRTGLQTCNLRYNRLSSSVRQNNIDHSAIATGQEMVAQITVIYIFTLHANNDVLQPPHCTNTLL